MAWELRICFISPVSFTLSLIKKSRPPLIVLTGTTTRSSVYFRDFRCDLFVNNDTEIRHISMFLVIEINCSPSLRYSNPLACHFIVANQFTFKMQTRCIICCKIVSIEVDWRSVGSLVEVTFCMFIVCLNIGSRTTLFLIADFPIAIFPEGCKTVCQRWTISIRGQHLSGTFLMYPKPLQCLTLFIFCFLNI